MIGRENEIFAAISINVIRHNWDENSEKLDWKQRT